MNESSKDYLERNKIVDSSKIKRISGSGVNLDRFTVKKYPDDSTNRFAFISRVLREKGIEEYLEAASMIKQRYPNTEFHIYGFCEDDYRGNLEEEQKKGTVIFHGMIDDVPGFLENIHCLIHHSYYLEGLSNVCIEAAAAGRPVITTDREGCKETVIDGKTGYIIPVKNANALVNAIDRFMKLENDEKRMMGLAGRKFIEENYDRKSIVSAYMEEIRKI